MHGREEWVLVQLGSQHKFEERPVQPVQPVYSVSCDYDGTNHVKKTGSYLAFECNFRFF